MSYNQNAFAETPVSDNETVESNAKKPSKKRVFSRFMAFVLMAMPVALLFFFEIPFLKFESSVYSFQSKKALDVVLDMFVKNKDAYSKLFGFLPLYDKSTIIGTCFSLGFYAIPLCIVFTLVFMIIGVCSGKSVRAMVRTITFLNVAVYGTYSFVIFAVAKIENVGLPFKFEFTSFDPIKTLVLLAITAISLVFYFIYGAIKSKKHFVPALLMFVLALGFAGSLFYACAYKDGFTTLRTLSHSTEKSFIPALTVGKLYTYLTLALVGLSLVGVLFTLGRIATTKGYTFGIIRSVVNLVVAGFALYLVLFGTQKDVLKDTFMIYVIVSVACAFLSLVLCIIAISAGKKKKAKKQKAEKKDEVVDQPVVEEKQPVVEEEKPVEEEVAAEPEEEEDNTGAYAEAVRYEPETVNAVEADAVSETELEEPVQLVMPAFMQHKEEEPKEEKQETPASSPASTAPYDFYNSKSFDPFIASLNDKEREQFTDIFILKNKGEFKNIPDYQVGGENSDFFRKVFIFLGSYRDKIPDGLLAKMYQFAVKK